jgi:hypothetical protein
MGLPIVDGKSSISVISRASNKTGSDKECIAASVSDLYDDFIFKYLDYISTIIFSNRNPASMKEMASHRYQKPDRI